VGVIGSVAVQGMLGGMPEAADLRCTEVEGQVVISVGARAVSSFPAGDWGCLELGPRVEDNDSGRRERKRRLGGDLHPRLGGACARP
jgi:hypothetical protein